MTGSLPVDRQIIIENNEKAEKLLHHIQTFPTANNTGNNYRLIQKPQDVLEWFNDSSLIGLFTTETIEWTRRIDSYGDLGLTLVRGQRMSIDSIIHWLSDHGYRAKKDTDEGNYLLQGDTLTLHTKKGIVRVGFMGHTIEDIYLDTVPCESFMVIDRT